VETPWMSHQEVAAYLRISSTAVYRLVEQHHVLTRYHIPELTQSPLYRRDEVEGIVLPDDQAKRRPPQPRPPTPRERAVLTPAYEDGRSGTVGGM
jgi:hypothetical protein